MNLDSNSDRNEHDESDQERDAVINDPNMRSLFIGSNSNSSGNGTDNDGGALGLSGLRRRQPVVPFNSE